MEDNCLNCGEIFKTKTGGYLRKSLFSTTFNEKRIKESVEDILGINLGSISNLRKSFVCNICCTLIRKIENKRQNIKEIGAQFLNRCGNDSYFISEIKKQNKCDTSGADHAEIDVKFECRPCHKKPGAPSHTAHSSHKKKQQEVISNVRRSKRLHESQKVYANDEQDDEVESKQITTIASPKKKKTNKEQPNAALENNDEVGNPALENNDTSVSSDEADVDNIPSDDHDDTDNYEDDVKCNVTEDQQETPPGQEPPVLHIKVEKPDQDLNGQLEPLKTSDKEDPDLQLLSVNKKKHQKSRKAKSNTDNVPKVRKRPHSPKSGELVQKTGKRVRKPRIKVEGESASQVKNRNVL